MSRSPAKPKGYQIGSPGVRPSEGHKSSPNRVVHTAGANATLGQGIIRSRSRSRSPDSPERKAPEALNRELDPSRKPSPGGPPKRIRKGRGFSDQYAYVRKYRTPSPERSPVRSHYYRGRYEQERGRNR